MMLAWLTLIGAAIGVRERSHFTLHVLHLTPAQASSIVDRIHHVLIAIIGAIAAWYGVRALHAQPHAGDARPEINLAVLYASAVVGGALLVVYAISMIVAPPPHDPDGVH